MFSSNSLRVIILTTIDPEPRRLCIVPFQTAQEERMSDNPNNRGGQDRSRINASQDHELDYWMQKWGVSRDELRQAVQKAGPMAKDVADELGKTL
jgi:hypothetical protein